MSILHSTTARRLPHLLVKADHETVLHQYYNRTATPYGAVPYSNFCNFFALYCMITLHMGYARTVISVTFFCSLLYDHFAYGLRMGSWYVVCAWSVSHYGHRWDMGCVTWWVSIYVTGSV